MYCRPEKIVNAAATHMKTVAPSSTLRKRPVSPVSTVRIWKNVAALPAHVGRG